MLFAYVKCLNIMLKEKEIINDSWPLRLLRGAHKLWGTLQKLHK